MQLPALFLGIALAALPSLLVAAEPARPNILFIIADDLGYGDLSCTGQKKFTTPNIDRIATGGMRMTVHYSGSSVCAPSRCVLMTGHHPGHGAIRENAQASPKGEGQVPVPAGALTLPLTLKKLGYTTGAFGKWGLGAPATTGEPLQQGIDRFYGYNCQAAAHNYYPTHLWDNDKHIEIGNPGFPAHQKLPDGADAASPATYAAFNGKNYAPDLIGEQARKFLQTQAAQKDKPFFLFYPTTVPHLALQVPEDSLKEFAGKYPETPYTGGRGYLPHATPRAAYAAMITRLDREIGKLLDILHEQKLDESTIVVFTSDNGPLYDELGGTDADFFASAGSFRGRKGSLYEGGVRVPCLVRWTGHIAPGTTSDRMTGFEDWLPTLLELAGAKDQTSAGRDGASFAPTLLGQKQPERPFLYRETPGYTGQQSVRSGQWKAVRQNLNPPKKAANPKPPTLELFDLAADPGETKDLAPSNPEELARLSAIMKAEHTPSTRWPISVLDGAAAK